jgi:hypothetical protein
MKVTLKNSGLLFAAITIVGALPNIANAQILEITQATESNLPNQITKVSKDLGNLGLGQNSAGNKFPKINAPHGLGELPSSFNINGIPSDLNVNGLGNLPSSFKIDGIPTIPDDVKIEGRVDINGLPSSYNVKHEIDYKGDPLVNLQFGDYSHTSANACQGRIDLQFGTSGANVNLNAFGYRNYCKTLERSQLIAGFNQAVIQGDLQAANTFAHLLGGVILRKWLRLYPQFRVK